MSSDLLSFCVVCNSIVWLSIDLRLTSTARHIAMKVCLILKIVKVVVIIIVAILSMSICPSCVKCINDTSIQIRSGHHDLNST